MPLADLLARLPEGSSQDTARRAVLALFEDTSDDRYRLVKLT